MTSSEMLPWLVAGIAAAGFVLNFVIQVRGGAWNAAKRESEFQEGINKKLDAKFDELSKSNRDAVDKVRAEMTANLASLNVDLDAARRESQEQHEDTIHKFGDTITALRQKVNDDALLAEKRFSAISQKIADDTIQSERMFMRREDFTAWSTIHNQKVDTLDRKVDDRFNRIEDLLMNRPAIVTNPR